MAVKAHRVLGRRQQTVRLRGYGNGFAHMEMHHASAQRLGVSAACSALAVSSREPAVRIKYAEQRA